MKREPEEVIVMSEATYQQLMAWRQEKETVGYVITHRQSNAQHIIWPLIVSKLGSGTATAIEREDYDKEMAQSLTDLVTSNPDMPLILMPTHSHPIEGLSEQDEATMFKQAGEGYNHHLIVTPKKVRAYRTDLDIGKITELQVAKVTTFAVPMWVFETANLLTAISA